MRDPRRTLPARATGRLLRPLQSAPAPSFGSGDPGHGVVSDLPIEILSIAVCREGEAGLQQRGFLRVGTVGETPLAGPDLVGKGSECTPWISSSWAFGCYSDLNPQRKQTWLFSALLLSSRQ